jgi:hypothetical protein
MLGATWKTIHVPLLGSINTPASGAGKGGRWAALLPYRHTLNVLHLKCQVFPSLINDYF